MFLFFKKNFYRILTIFILTIILAYVTNITTIPENIILFKNENLSIKTVAGIKITEAIPVGSSLSDNNKLKSETREYNVSLLGINLRKIKADVLNQTTVIPLGNIIGLKLYTQGVLVVGKSQIEGEDNKIYKPYESSGIDEGDSIIKINNETISNTNELLKCVSKYKGKEMNITFIKNGEEKNGIIKPVKVSNNLYKLGLWVRDSAAGVGTATFYEKNSNTCATLGHSIQDIDTGKIVEISTGEIVTSKIDKIEKGEKDNPGRIEGNIENSAIVGKIYSNTEFGIYGNVINRSTLNINEQKEMKVATRNEIKTGKASIMCAVENENVKEYEVQIQKIFKANNSNNKSMIIKITDKNLLEKTGGIIQGMSGSPIIQNGKFVGALTHVLVSDPTVGYGVFGDIMLNQIKKMN